KHQDIGTIMARRGEGIGVGAGRGGEQADEDESGGARHLANFCRWQVLARGERGAPSPPTPLPRGERGVGGILRARAAFSHWLHRRGVEPGWPGRPRNGVAGSRERQEAAPCGCAHSRKDPLSTTLAVGALSHQERGWRSLLSLRDPAALRDGWATRSPTLTS